MTFALRAGRALLVGSLLAAAAPARAADPWTPLHPVPVSSVVRSATGGWLLSPSDADGDPILATPVSEPAVWAMGRSDAGMVQVRGGVALPMGNARVTLRLSGARRESGGDGGTLAALPRDNDGDGYADTLAWTRQAGPTGERSDQRDFAARLGLRLESWGVGAWVRTAQSEDYPTATVFSFPATSVAAAATGSADTLFDLGTGDILALRTVGADMVLRRHTLGGGGDLGVRFGAVGIGVGAGWVGVTTDDIAHLDVDDSFLGSSRNVSAKRDVAQGDDAIVLALRLDGRHALDRRRLVLWSAGGRLRQPLQTTWSGTETLTERTDGVGGTLTREWVRTPALDRVSSRGVESTMALGFADARPEWSYGVGLAWRFSRDERAESWRDDVDYRVDDPGLVGQRPAAYTRASGFGDWERSMLDERHEVTLGMGGRAALNNWLGVLAGADLSYRTARSRFEQELVAVADVAGSETIEPNVVNGVVVPYANFQAETARHAVAAATAQRLSLGLTLGGAPAQVALVLQWQVGAAGAGAIEGVWRF